MDNTLVDAYLQSTQEFFLAKPTGLDFGKSEEARNTINQWVEEQTNNKIKELLAKESVDASTKLVLVNAIYFKGDWDVKFDKSRTRKDDFHVTPDHVVQVDMMFSKQDYA